MPSLDPRKWGRKNDGEEMANQMAPMIPIAASDTARSPSDIETQQQLGINIHMIESETLMADLARIAERHYRVPLMRRVPTVREGIAVIDPNGDKVYEEVPLTDKDGNPMFEERVYYHPVFYTLKVHMDKLFSTRFLDPIDAEIAICQVEHDFNALKMQLSYDEYRQWGSYIDALKRMAISAICDSKKGRKAKLMKVTPRTYEMTFHQPEKGKQERGYNE